MYSPDGRWWWDGLRWVPAPQARIRQRPWPWIVAAIAAALVALAVIASAASRGASPRAAAAPALAAPAAQAAPAARDGSCAPQPCANDGYGWIVSVNGLRYDAAGGTTWEHPESGNVYVTVSVTFTNRLDKEQHANPFNFVLEDGAGVKHAVSWFTSCPLWAGVNLTSGASLGPKCLGFQATAGRPSGLVLVWTPQFGGGDYQIGLS
jgi:hypothetical protein